MNNSLDCYKAGIRQAYEGEWMGERVYGGCATQAADAAQRSKFLAIAQVERVTHQWLQPIARRLDINIEVGPLLLRIERRVAQLARLSWIEFIDKAMREWPPFVQRFKHLESGAPNGDARALKALVRHEIALVEFVRREHEREESAFCMAPLHAYLAERPGGRQD